MFLSRESRLILILVVFGVISVATLGYMAERYKRLLLPDDPTAVAARPPAVAPTRSPQPTAVRDERSRVEGYLVVREAIARAARTLVPPEASSIDDPVGYSLSNLRDVQLMRQQLTPRDYVELRALELRWLAGEPGLDSGVRQAFERERERFESAAVPAFDAWERR